ncbi:MULTISPECIES: DUF4342 domain-containing protein [Desulfofundulus]|jgi:hypothetical protein|uniref:DUF4342 domain-containing protein n=1 Tax=Desulfofundulus australicus DSM 11792 TaxID=1121425 RepID=A0A1M4V049_9FIRM|nr:MULTISPECIES: DUF4342 domain-containing protein [Desulfofundulus]MBE3585558.1 DUF4342 domain-containing protein [Thermoanaerobacter sp.]MCS5696171.1 DUF4342 domain-containing protein [Desulfofundulus thermocisternus]MDK2888155.1 hypothetical protein [Thermoanaerobacter sp.]SHE62273.1 protein of unknown function [Desulfofundulus australicus DSM 11792]
MNSELEKIDLIRSRLGVGYKEAKEALDAAGGDVVQALIHLEEERKNIAEKLQDRGEEFWENVKDFLHRSQETKIKVKQGDRTVMELPAPLGALGLLGTLASSQLAVLGVLGAVTAMAKNYTLEIERPGREDRGDEGQGEQHWGPAGPTQGGA